MDELLPLSDETDVLLQPCIDRLPAISPQSLIRSNSVMDDKEYIKRHFQRVTICADVPVMTLNDRESKSGTTFNSVTHHSTNASLPYFCYEHGDSVSRNLPGHAQLIRILAEISKQNAGNKSGQSNAEFSAGMANNWLSLYTTEKPVQIVRKRIHKNVRISMCSFCQERGGKHKKWCVNFVEIPVEDPYGSMKRSKTDVSDYFRRPKNPKPVLVEKPPTVYKQFQLRPSDYPDYTSLHKEVYEHALAVMKAKLDKKLVKKKRFILERQLTDPFIFSYMNRYGTRNEMKTGNGMVHIFGERNVDFTKHYEYSVRKIKEKNKGKQLSK